MNIYQKVDPLFVGLSIVPIQKISDFSFYVYSHLCKNVFDFGSLTKKLHNPNYKIYSLSKNNAMDVVAADISQLTHMLEIHTSYRSYTQ